LGAFRNKQVWLSIAITILGYGGMFGAFTYIAFTLTEVTGFATSSVPWLLILFGSGLFVGNFLGAKAADRSLTKSLVWILAILTVVLIVFAATAESKVMTVISLFFMGAFGFATVPGLQMRIMNYASAAPTMASGANIAAFNVGNALGAWLGGITIAAGLGFTSPIWMGAAVTVAGLLVMIERYVHAGQVRRNSAVTPENGEIAPLPRAFDAPKCWTRYVPAGVSAGTSHVMRTTEPLLPTRRQCSLVDQSLSSATRVQDPPVFRWIS
jgi:predicted MFS family arabinose efflux permease